MAAFTDPVFVVVTIAIAILASLLPSRLERWWGHWSTRRAERTRIGEDRLARRAEWFAAHPDDVTHDMLRRALATA
jgi:hypothetical protein